ncbi:DEAD/DEAH box helicase [Nitrospira sp. Kam-Ns4a]
MVLSGFHPVIADWFRGRFGAPTAVQAQAWPAIASGRHVLIAAPTGSGKTLAAFLTCLDALFRQALAGELEERTQVLYVSPLKALSNDVQKNLRQPLAEIAEAALAAGWLLPAIRVAVRTGDTPASDRQHMLRRPPHILITTPESLFLLLTARKSRALLRDVRTVIVDEIHAVAPNKRGAHLALSLERLEGLTPVSPRRIGLSATQRPIETIAHFLVGAGGARGTGQGASGEESGASCLVVDVGHQRELDLAVEVPKDELGAVATNAIWSNIYDRLAELVAEHRSTLVFVNTRRLAERVAHALDERLRERLGAEVVAAHHGSLSRQIRLSAEERLKGGQTRVVVATASLELGIDVGTVDLVCQIGSPRAISTALQRVGRAGHWVGAVPKGRFFATTRDELVECAALVQAIRSGTLDRIAVPPAPLDILAQQIVAEVAAQEWGEEELFALCRRAWPYRDLARQDFDAVVRMLAEGVTTRRGRGRAYLHHDRINGRLRARRGARLAAITSGGAIPDTANYVVVAEPEGTVVGSVDEDFAVESLAGDIILLGNASWRIRGVEMGKVRVEDAHGAPPTIPFWRGEAPARTRELSAAVAAVREEIEARLRPGPVGAAEPDLTEAVRWLADACSLDRRGAEQAAAYVAAGRAVLGTVPTQRTVIAERFFDEAGGMQLVLHAPFGGRINRAWGLALRKRFCTTFDFELQAAATDEGLVLSLGEHHSFPLAAVFEFLQADALRETLVPAVLAAPMFATRWRWNATRALALLRFAEGRRVPPQIQRMRAEDLLAAIFPGAMACQDNHRDDAVYQAPTDHPLVTETIRDCLTEAMDFEGLVAVLRQIEHGEIRCLAVDTPAPSPFSHEILNANPYAYLDDAPLEERRARAVEMRRSLPPDLAAGLGALDPAAIAEVAEEAWPVVRDPDELHDALLSLIWVPAARAGEWAAHLPVLLETGRAVIMAVRRGDAGTPGADPPASPSCPVAPSETVTGWVATERLAVVRAIFPDAVPSPAVPALDRGEAVATLVRGWMESTGPTTAAELAGTLCLPSDLVRTALLRLEAEGQVLRGHFRPFPHPAPASEEWCDRRLLTRIHRLTVGRLRREVEPVTTADFMRFLFQWQHVAPGARLHGEEGLLEVIRQLAGFEAAASAWEHFLLPVRMAKYDPAVLDRLCLSGAVAWGRLSPHPGLLGRTGAPATIQDNVRAGKPPRIIPTSVAPLSLFPREDAGWLLRLAESGEAGVRSPAGLSGTAQDLLRWLEARGASFFTDLTAGTGRLPAEVEDGLWELVAAGLVTADGFDNLRALLDPRRRRAQGRERARRPRHGTGRWALLRLPITPHSSPTTSLEPMARQLLRRYGVVFRDLLKRESLCPAWRDLLVIYRRMELRGEVRGGRFLGGFTGEQFALPEAVESLRALRKAAARGGRGPMQEIRLSGADPLNLVGVILPGARVPASPAYFIVFRDGLPVRTGLAREPTAPGLVTTTESRGPVEAAPGSTPDAAPAPA